MSAPAFPGIALTDLARARDRAPSAVQSSDEGATTQKGAALKSPASSPSRSRRKSDTGFDELRLMLDLLLRRYDSPREKRIAVSFFRLGYKKGAQDMGAKL